MLRVEVRDDGIGGADPPATGSWGCNDRVTALGGQLGVESPPGGGTVLTATLPISRERVASRPTPAEGARRSRSRCGDRSHRPRCTLLGDHLSRGD